jgi:hypothetical protein
MGAENMNQLCLPHGFVVDLTPAPEHHHKETAEYLAAMRQYTPRGGSNQTKMVGAMVVERAASMFGQTLQVVSGATETDYGDNDVWETYRFGVDRLGKASSSERTTVRPHDTWGEKLEQELFSQLLHDSLNYVRLARAFGLNFCAPIKNIVFASSAEAVEDIQRHPDLAIKMKVQAGFPRGDVMILQKSLGVSA